MPIDREKAVDRIRKLLNHAKGPGDRHSDAEIDTYLNYARKLMDEFNIEEAELIEHTPKSVYDSIVEENVYGRAGRLDQFMVTLAWTPCNICDVKFYLKKEDDPKWKAKHPNDKGYRWGRRKIRFVGLRQCIIFYGLPKDVAIAADLYKELLTTARVMCKVRYGDSRPPEYKNYCTGFASRLQQRSSEMKQQSTEASNTTAIVLRKTQILEDWANDKLNLTSRVRRSMSGLGDGFSEGYEDGENVSLETNQIRGTSRAQIS